MDSIETRQRIKYLVEHGGLWDQEAHANSRSHHLLIALLVVVIVLELVMLLR